MKLPGWAIVTALGLACGNSANALPVPISLPGYTADLGTELFKPSNTLVSAELFDLAGNVLPAGAEFGFYGKSNSSTLVTIFDSGDQGPPLQVAAINFAAGVVLDVDASAVQSLFTPSLDDIGFYLTVGTTTLYTQSALNPGGLDLAGVYRDMNSSNFIIGFEDPRGTPLALELVAGVRSVPEPATLALLGAGALGMVASRRRRNTR